MKILVPALLAVLCLCACVTPARKPDLFDLGPAQDKVARTTVAQTLPAISLAEIQTPAWLDGPTMYYRLLYENAQQPRPYAGSRWSMTPALLLDQRLRSRLTEAGGTVIPAADGATNLPMLRIEADDFTQNFSSPSRSEARVALRVSVFSGHNLLAQKTFTAAAATPSADATGGAQGLATASDAAIDELLSWLPGVMLKK